MLYYERKRYARHKGKKVRIGPVAGFVTGCFLGSTLLLTPSASAQEKQLTIRFTKMSLYDIATDIHGEKTEKIASRIVGLSPPVTAVRIHRTETDVTLGFTVKVEGNLTVKFDLTLDKMTFYRMATARTDVDGMLKRLQVAREHEPLILSVEYRYDEHYCFVDLALDLRPAILAREEAMREAAAQFVPSPPTGREASPQGEPPEGKNK